MHSRIFARAFGHEKEYKRLKARGQKSVMLWANFAEIDMVKLKKIGN